MTLFKGLAFGIFLLVGIAHLLRLVLAWPVTVGTQVIPMWVSVVGVVVPLTLVAIGWFENRASRREADVPLSPLPPVEDLGAIYGELYNEMRRYRDYEFQSSTWYTAMLIAVLAFLISQRFDKPNDLTVFGAALATNWLVKLALLTGTGALGFISCRLVYYASCRYDHIRRYTDRLEPTWKTQTFVPLQRGLSPRQILYATPVVLVLISWVVILWPSH